MHDRNGTKLQVGDVVMLPCVITGIADQQQDFCNVTLTTRYGRRPDNQKDTIEASNTGQVVLFERPAQPGSNQPAAE